MNFQVAVVIGILYSGSELALGLMKRAKSGARTADRGSFALIWGVIVVCMVVAYSAPFFDSAANFGAHAAHLQLIIGLVLFGAGLALRWWSIIHLGRFFTVNVAIAQDQHVIDTGPYRRIRHPSYSGALLAFVGLGLVLNNWISLIMVTVPVFLVFHRRMQVEEDALRAGLGEPYRDYMRRTRRLIPGVY